MTRPDDQRPDDWSDLAEVWTAPQDGPDMIDLVARLRRRAWLARLNFLFEAWGAVLAGLFGVWMAWRHEEPVMGGAALVFAAFALVATLWARRGAEPGLADTPAEALRAAAAQARSGLRWARAGQAVTAGALLFVIVVAVDAGGVPGGVWVYLAIGVVLALCGAFYERHARRARARAAGHRAALEEMEDAA